MSRWDNEENNKDNLRYSIIMQKDGTIKIVDLATGKVDWINVEMLSLGGSGKASDYKEGFLFKMKELEEKERELTWKLKDLEKKLPADPATEFYNMNFSWKELCQSELGLKYMDDKK